METITGQHEKSRNVLSIHSTSCTVFTTGCKYTDAAVTQFAVSMHLYLEGTVDQSPGQKLH